MIKNERQYGITKERAERFAQTLTSVRLRSGEDAGIHPLIAKAQEDALSSQLADLERELREYESLNTKTGACVERDTRMGIGIRR